MRLQTKEWADANVGVIADLKPVKDADIVAVAGLKRMQSKIIAAMRLLTS